MKASRVRKRKTADAPQEIITGVKKATTRIGGRHTCKTERNDKTLEGDDPAILPSTTPQVVDQQLLKKDELPQETKLAQEVKPKAGLPLEKIKLQLFPVDDATRNKLMKDGHNPYLELTLRPRKKISSVLKHLNNKWGSSSVAVGEVMLFPYDIQPENLSSYKRWSMNDNHSCAKDVYADIESPAHFRLRYGWFTKLDTRISKTPSRFTTPVAPGESQGLQKSSGRIPLMDINRKLEGTTEAFKQNFTSKTSDADEKKPVKIAVDRVSDEDKNKSLTRVEMPWDDSFTNLSIGGLFSDISLFGKIKNCDSKSKGTKTTSQPINLFSSDISISGLFSEASRQEKVIDNKPKLSGTKPNLQPTVDNNRISPSLLWDDSFTELSIGGLISEASRQAKIEHQNNSELQPTQLVSDSFDSFTFDGIRSQTQKSKPSAQVSHISILDGEETCHAFSFGKSSWSGKSSSPLVGSSNLTNCDNVFEASKTGQLAHPRADDNERSLGLGGIKWTESLGPFDICLPSAEQNRSQSGVSIGKFIK